LLVAYATMLRLPMTAEAKAVQEKELKHRLQIERPRIIQQIADRRPHDSDCRSMNDTAMLG